MSHKHIEMSVDEHAMMSTILIIIDMIVRLARVIGLRLMNELGETDTTLIVLDFHLLCLMLTPVRHLRLLNLVLVKIHLFHRGIRRPFLNLRLT